MKTKPNNQDESIPRHLPSDGTPVWFDQNGMAWKTKDGAVAHFVKLGPATARKGYERQLPSGSQLGMSEMDRSHSIGAGNGVESPFGINYEHITLNRGNWKTMSKRDIETMFGRLYDNKPENMDLYVVMETYSKPSNSKNHDGACLDRMNYQIWAKQRGSTQNELTLKESFGNARQMKKQSKRLVSGSIEVHGNPQKPKIVAQVEHNSIHKSQVIELVRRPEPRTRNSRSRTKKSPKI